MSTKCPCDFECSKDGRVCECGPDCECLDPNKKCISPYNLAPEELDDRQKYQPEYSQKRLCVDCGSHWFYWFNKTCAHWGSNNPPFIHVVFCSKCGKPHPIQ